MNPLALTATIILSFLVLLLPRRQAAIPLILAACYLTLGQQIVIFSLNFTILRIIIFFGWIRILLRKELYEIKINALDKLMVWWVIVAIVTGVFLIKTFGGFINRMGFAYNTLGLYFFFRATVSDFEDVDYIIAVLAVIVFPLAVIMVHEKLTGHNIFSIFGGVPEVSAVRNGRLRCQGPFRHPILAGTFGATLMPLMVGQWLKGGRSRLIDLMGIIGATVITVTPSSSGPAVAYCFVTIGMLMWPLRDRMRIVRRALLIGILSLHFIMKAPVWFLIARLSELIGGTGYHRSKIIDQAIRYFNEWWLVGTTYTAHWMPYVLPNNPKMTDITSQYIGQAVDGGIGRLILFILIIIRAFRNVGEALHSFDEEDFGNRILCWAIGVSLLGHTVSFISVAYFDQIIVFWYLLLSMIASLPNSNASEPKVSNLEGD